MMVAPKSGMGPRFAFEASIGEPQCWQKAFSSRTASPHLGQLIISLMSSSCNSKQTRPNGTAVAGNFVIAQCLRIGDD